MIILDDNQCSQWLSSRQFQFEEAVSGPRYVEGFVFLPSDGFSAVFNIPDDSRIQVMLTQRLAHWPEGQDVLLWMTSWATYREEEMEVFLEFRRQSGETRPLINAPGHLLNTASTEDVWTMRQLLLLMTAFNWEGFVLQADRQLILWMADSVVETYTLKRGKHQEVLDVIEELSLEVVSPS